MSRVAAIGEQGQVQGFALAGVEIHLATKPDDVRAAWLGLPEDIAVVILTPTAAAVLEDLGTGDRLTVLMPT